MVRLNTKQYIHLSIQSTRSCPTGSLSRRRTPGECLCKICTGISARNHWWSPKTWTKTLPECYRHVTDSPTSILYSVASGPVGGTRPVLIAMSHKRYLNKTHLCNRKRSRSMQYLFEPKQALLALAMVLAPTVI